VNLKKKDEFWGGKAFITIVFVTQIQFLHLPFFF